MNICTELSKIQILIRKGVSVAELVTEDMI